MPRASSRIRTIPRAPCVLSFYDCALTPVSAVISSDFEVAAGTLILDTPSLAAQIPVCQAGYHGRFFWKRSWWNSSHISTSGVLWYPMLTETTTFTIDPVSVPNAAAALAILEAFATVRVARWAAQQTERSTATVIESQITIAALLREGVIRRRARGCR